MKPNDRAEPSEAQQSASRGLLRGRGLLFGVSILLTFALLPLGTIAVFQTWRAIKAAEDTFIATLRAQTTRLTAPEREAFNSALGLSRGLSNAVAVLQPNDEECSALMRRTAATDNRIVFAGLVGMDGISRCNTSGVVQDFSGTQATGDIFAAPRPVLTFDPEDHATGQPVVIVSEPMYGTDGGFLGFFSLSFSATRLAEERAPIEISDGAAVLTFNARGEVLTAGIPRDVMTAVLPADLALSDLVGQEATSFRRLSAAGDERFFALVPIAPGRAYALGSWPSDAAIPAGSAIFAATTLASPILMWIASMAVAIIALDRLVLRHVGGLGRRMRSFAEGRRFVQDDQILDAPREIQNIGKSFVRMAHQIVRDEAELENTLHEREVLLKEVHHRVKNNLQLISSIINMQVRQTESPETRAALRRIQDRIASLAAVHRGLYQAPSIARIEVDELINYLVGQLAPFGERTNPELLLTRDLDRVELDPDQAAPLAMLTTEAVTNAIRYGEPNAEGDQFVHVSLKVCVGGEDRKMRLEVRNSSRAGTDGKKGYGLGRQLMAGFADQLGGGFEEVEKDGEHILRVTFPVCETPHEGNAGTLGSKEQKAGKGVGLVTRH